MATTLTVVGGVLAGLAVAVVATPAAAAPPATISPVVPRTSTTPSADALPTVQMDGVAWSQAIAGDKVWVGGKFTNARPAGAAAGTNLTARNNVLVYNINTGNLITSINPNLNGQAKSVVASPDGSRVYVGGQFTTTNGVNRYRLAAYDSQTGALITSFAPSLDSTVNAIAVTNSTVYVGGYFSKANNQPRSHLAAFAASNGALTTWNPGSDGDVNSMVATPDGQKIVVGGSFATLGGQSFVGMGAVDPVNGSPVTWNVSNSVKNTAPNAAILTLSADAEGNVYGGGYVYGSSGNLEGAFSANQTNGDINWIQDCHGDTYGVAANSNAVFVVSHAHYCGNVGGFPQTSPTWTFHRAMAFTKQATGTVQHDPLGYHDWYGNPSPSIVNWWPELAAGTFTGKTQAAWTVAANDKYVVQGGEFPKVNNVGQQGLVRFALRSDATNKRGPQLSSTGWNLSARSLAANSARVAFPSNWDPDDLSLTYSVYRDSVGNAPVYTTTANSTPWDQPNLGFTDSGLTPGQTYQYKVYARDADGNTASSDWIQVTANGGSLGTYAQGVLADGASKYWRLGDTSTTTAYDYAGFDDLTLTGVTRGRSGAVTGDQDLASGFSGNNSFGATGNAVPGPDRFTIEAWFKTTSTSGGKIVSFGDRKTGLSGNYDRHVYMDPAGRIFFGVYNNASYTVNTTKSYNNGQWHQVTASLGATGLTLYVDGVRIGTNAGTTTGQPYSGYWRVGGDSPWNGNAYFAGDIDDVAIYPQPLTLTQVRKHYSDGSGIPVGGTAPADAYGKAVYADTPDLYYRLDDTSRPTVSDASGNGATGTYYGSPALGQTSGVTGASGTAVRFDGAEGTGLSSDQSVSNPTAYTEELWFKTTTTNGGKLIGFGSSQQGRSGSYDRHVYMETDGRLTFGTYTGQLNTTTSPRSYNDGAWHYLAASQGADGMQLYVDGALVGANPQRSAQPYDGYWRVGGDTAWNNTGYFAGTIDEVAVYSQQLSASQIGTHYGASPLSPQPPTAAFTASPTDLTVALDAGASTGSSPIAAYTWDFGDGTAASGATTSHTYGAAGSYPITLTVTDNRGLSNSTTRTVAVLPANRAPVAAFTASATNLAVEFDGTTSNDPDGSIVSYAWNFGDDSTDSVAKPTHAYAQPGTYTVGLAVTDDRGATTSTSKVVTVTAANVAPSASFTTATSDLKVDVDAAASTDSDGSIASYAWNFGDGSTATGATASRTYVAGGTYTVTLTVTDNRGGQDTTTRQVTVAAPNQKPTATFTSNPSGLGVTLNASGSSDPDGSIVSYAWNFGDNITGTGVTTTHAYTAPGSYPVSLTVTDNRGATDVASTTVTVVDNTPVTLARDRFTRSVTNGWGSAETGGAWTLTGGATRFAVNGAAGTMTLPSAGATNTAMLNSVSQGDTNLSVDFTTDKAATGGGYQATLIAHRVGTSDYRVTARLTSTNTVTLALTKVVNGVATGFGEKTITGLTYAAGDVLTLRLTVTKSGGSTALAGTVWKAGTTEPTAQRTATDDTAALQGPGAVGLSNYIAGSATNAPVVGRFDNLSVTNR